MCVCVDAGACADLERAFWADVDSFGSFAHAHMRKPQFCPAACSANDNCNIVSTPRAQEGVFGERDLLKMIHVLRDSRDFFERL